MIYGKPIILGCTCIEMVNEFGGIVAKAYLIINTGEIFYQLHHRIARHILAVHHIRVTQNLVRTVVVPYASLMSPDFIICLSVTTLSVLT